MIQNQFRMRGFRSSFGLKLRGEDVDPQSTFFFGSIERHSRWWWRKVMALIDRQETSL